MRKTLKKPSYSKALATCSAKPPERLTKMHPLLARFGLGIAFVLIAAIPLSYVAIPTYQIFDEQGAKPHDTVGVVTWRSNPGGDGVGTATIRSGGNQLVCARADNHDVYFGWGQAVQIGDRFKIFYRIGRSGRIYVQRASQVALK